MARGKARFFRSAEELRAWLDAHQADRDELVIGFYKKRATKSGITYPEALDEALSVGWIDGVRRSIDEERYEMRFTPRKKGSIWSKVNVAHVARLTEAGRMRPAGIAAFEARLAGRTGVYSFEQSRPTELDASRADKLRANVAAQAFFDAQPPSYRRTAAFWVMSAKQDATRDRRLESLIASSAKGEVAPPFAFGRSANWRSRKRAQKTGGCASAEREPGGPCPPRTNSKLALAQARPNTPQKKRTRRVR